MILNVDFLRELDIETYEDLIIFMKQEIYQAGEKVIS